MGVMKMLQLGEIILRSELKGKEFQIKQTKRSIYLISMQMLPKIFKISK